MLPPTAKSRIVNRSIGEMRVAETFTYCTARSYDHLHAKALYLMCNLEQHLVIHYATTCRIRRGDAEIMGPCGSRNRTATWPRSTPRLRLSRRDNKCKRSAEQDEGCTPARIHGKTSQIARGPRQASSMKIMAALGRDASSCEY